MCDERRNADAGGRPSGAADFSLLVQAPAPLGEAAFVL